MPPATPRHPAWTTDRRPDDGSASATGTQSAARTAMATPLLVVVIPSAPPNASSGSRKPAPFREGPARTMRAPCCCRTHANDSIPSAATKRRRFSATASTSSPDRRPRLSEANDPVLAPPVRSVHAMKNPSDSSCLEVRNETPSSVRRSSMRETLLDTRRGVVPAGAEGRSAGGGRAPRCRFRPRPGGDPWRESLALEEVGDVQVLVDVDRDRRRRGLEDLLVVLVFQEGRDRLAVGTLLFLDHAREAAAAALARLVEARGDGRHAHL